MDATPPPLAYAAPDGVRAQFERARRIFAGFALGFALVTAVNDSANVAGRWPENLSDRYAAPRDAEFVACLPLGIGAIALLFGHERGMTVVRWSAFALWCVSLTSIVAWRIAMRLPATASLSDGAHFLWTTARLVLDATFAVPGLIFCLSYPLGRGGRRGRLDAAAPIGTIVA